jgi:hypothetical protein
MSEQTEGQPTAVAGSRRASGRGRCILAAAVATLLGGVGLVIASVVPASAAPIIYVIDPTDAPDANLNGQCASTHLGLCTLRAAIQEAEFAGGGEVVLSAGIGDYQLTIPAGNEGNPTSGNNAPSNLTGDLDITQSITVTGSGPDVSVIDGMGAVRIFDVHRTGFLRLRGVTLQNGKGDYDSATGHRHGGAIHNHGAISLDHVAVVNSISTEPGWGGGGITNAGAPIVASALLQNVTVARNSTNLRGAGIENTGDLRMLNVTIAENTAPTGQGGGIFTGANSTSATNGLVAENTSGGDCATTGGTVQSGGYNLQGDGTCGFNQTTDRSGDPGFEPGLFNGKPIFYPLLSTSQAVDTGSPLICPATDIRGVVRPEDGNGDGVALCDIGSYEREADGQASLFIQDASVRERDHRSRDARFRISLSQRATRTVTVHVTTEEGTARAGSDFRPRRATLTFEPGDRHKHFTVQVRGDRIHEQDETFKVRLFAPTGAVIGDNEATGTIIDDD